MRANTLSSPSAAAVGTLKNRRPRTAPWAKVRKGVGHLWRQGPSGWAWLGYVAAISPWAHLARAPFHEIERRLVRARRRARSTHSFAPLSLPLVGAHQPLRLSALCSNLEEEVADLRQPGAQIVLAAIDHDGFALPAFEHYWDAPRTTPEAFLPRRKFPIHVVDSEGLVGLRKSYGRDLGGMLNELEAATMLIRAGLPAPSILAVDIEGRTITFSYIPGLDVRETLARAGARLRDRDRSQERAGGRRRANRSRIEEGRQAVDRALSPSTVAEITSGVENIHRAGLSLEDVKYGNVILEQGSGRAYFVDFERAIPLREFSRGAQRYVRDRDMHKLVRQFGGDGLTARRLRQRRLPGRGVYAPAYFGDDVKWGQFWNPDIGVGRWRYLMARHLPIPKGGRILDLGANNGFNALEMLRAGAQSAIAVEIDPAAIEQGKFLKRVYEWADNSPYDLTYVQGSHGALDELQLGRFDMISAFCTLYYLGEAEMAQTVRTIASMTDLLVLQCNTDRAIHRARDETFRKASLEFTLTLARENGFPHLEVVAPRGYSRPLVIARRDGPA